jgi:hypothetical protein
VFLDAHGYDLRKAILSSVIQGIQDRPHLVLVHDMVDLKYFPEDFRCYNADAESLAFGSAPPKNILGDVGSQYDEGIALADFPGRNHIGFYSAESAYLSELTEERARELEALFGPDFCRCGFWYYFSLNEAPGRTLTFPSAPPPPPPEVNDAPVPPKPPTPQPVQAPRRNRLGGAVSLKIADSDT